MVNFEDGKLVKDAYVEINGVQKKVNMPVYSGNTPLNAENLNKLQKDLQNDINNETNLRKNADNNLQEQINNVIAGAGTEGSSSAEILQARVNSRNTTFQTLNSRINFIEKSLPFIGGVAENIDFNNYLTPGKYIVTSISANRPQDINTDNIGSSGILIVESLLPNSEENPTSFSWILQTWIPWNFKANATRIIFKSTTNTIFNDWVINNNYYIDKLYKGLKRDSLSDNYNSNGIISDNNIDFNTLIKDGNYLVTTSNNNNIPFNRSGILNVETNYNDGDNYKWIVQTYNDIYMQNLAKRVIQYDVNTPENSIFREWKILYYEKPIDLDLKGKTIVNFGDSIFGNYGGIESISYAIQNITNATCYNVAFGGCRMSDRGTSFTTWNPFSMCNLATAIATKDFTEQDNAINNTSWTDKPTYFNQHLELLKNIDFSKVDYITISYGTNDYTAGTLLDNENNLYDKLTYAGALRYTIETLLSAYPNLRILIGTPIFRCWLNEDKTEVIETSDDKVFTPGNYNLSTMAQKCEEVGKNYHIPVLNVYDNLSFNKFNWSSIFTTTDTTHPNLYGRQCIAREYASALINM